jgi:hypothetical protein
MRTRELIRQGTPTTTHDLWPRLNARLRDDDDRIRVSLPALGWREATALAVAFGIVALVPDPLRFLIASGIL